MMADSKKKKAVASVTPAQVAGGRGKKREDNRPKQRAAVPVK